MPDLVEDEFDERELTAIELLMESPGWALVAARIARIREQSRDSLEREENPTVAAHLRGRTYMCRLALSIPGILRDEYRAAERDQEKQHGS